MTQSIRPFPQRGSRPARRRPRGVPRGSAMRSDVLAAALALALGLTGCEATGQPPEEATGQPPEEATGQPPEEVQPEEGGDGDSELRRLPVLRALDTDDDGDISAGEIDAAPESLASLDADGDGRLSGDELRPRRAGPRVFFGSSPASLPEGSRVMTLGADEELDMADLPPQLRSLLSAADGDGDGTASGAELLAVMMAAQAGEPGDREPGSAEEPVAPSLGTGTRGGGPQEPMPLMTALDADQDGTVSETEIESAAQSLRTLDTDGDGRVSASELRPAWSSDSSGNELPE